MSHIYVCVCTHAISNIDGWRACVRAVCRQCSIARRLHVHYSDVCLSVCLSRQPVAGHGRWIGTEAETVVSRAVALILSGSVIADWWWWFGLPEFNTLWRSESSHCLRLNSLVCGIGKVTRSSRYPSQVLPSAAASTCLQTDNVIPPGTLSGYQYYTWPINGHG